MLQIIVIMLQFSDNDTILFSLFREKSKQAKSIIICCISQLTKYFIETSYRSKHTKMFIYFVALIATPLIIFGLLHVRILNNWLRSRFRNCQSSTCTGFTHRPQIETLLIDEDNENACMPMSSLSVRKQVAEIKNMPLQKSSDNSEKTSDAFLIETERRLKNLNVPRYSFDSVLSEDRERDIGLNTRARKEDTLESLKDTIEKSINPSARLNITQIYNLIQKETLKQNMARQKLDIEKRRFNESVPLKITEHLPLSSEDEPEHEDESRRNLS